MIDDFTGKSQDKNAMGSVFSNIRCLSLQDGFAKITFDLSLYDIESIYSAVYSLLENSYFFFEGDDSALTVSVIPKDDKDVLKHVLELNNRVINYSFYKIKSVENKSIKQIILSKTLFVSDDALETSAPVSQAEVSEETCDSETCDCDPCDDSGTYETGFSECSCGCTEPEKKIQEESQEVPKAQEDVSSDDDFDFEDLDDIRVPWEEKHEKTVIEEEKEKLDSFFRKSGD